MLAATTMVAVVVDVVTVVVLVVVVVVPVVDVVVEVTVVEVVSKQKGFRINTRECERVTSFVYPVVRNFDVAANVYKVHTLVAVL